MVTAWFARWDRFLFAPVAVTPIAVFRIALGLLVFAWTVLMAPELDAFYGAGGLLSEATVREHLLGARLIVFAWVGGPDRWVRPAYWALVGCAAGLTLGVLTRLSAIGVFVFLSLFAARNPVVLNAGDSLMRILVLLLIFSAAGQGLSLDRLGRLLRGREPAGLPPPRAPWAQRLMQIELSLVYLTTYLWKIANPDWRDGTALYYVSRLEDFYRFPVPALFDHLGTIRLMTWGVLGVEFALGVLIWFPALRPWVLAAGVLLHLGIEYAMNIPLFQWIVIAAMVTFVSPEAFTHAGHRLRRTVERRVGPPTPVAFDGGRPRCRRLAALLQALDVLGRLALWDARHIGRGFEPPPGIDAEHVRRIGLLAVSGDGAREGFDALRWLAWRLPLLWPVAWTGYVPVVSAMERELYARLTAEVRLSSGPPPPATTGA